MNWYKLSIVCGLMLFLSTLASAKIVFRSKRDGNGKIYVINDDGTSLQRLTNTPFSDGAPQWSPNGKTIAFHRDLHSAGAGKGQQYDLFIMNADGSNPRNLTNHPALDAYPSWSPDGRYLAFTSSRGGRGTAEIFVIHISSGEVRQLTDYAKRDGYATSPSWSPDGKQIAYELSLPDRDRDIYIMDADGKNARPLTKPAKPLPGRVIPRFFPRWSPDGKQILYVEREYARIKGAFRPVSHKLFISHTNDPHRQRLAIPTDWRINLYCWTGDRAQILFSALSSAREDGVIKPGSNYEIYRYNRDNGQIINLTNNLSKDSNPDWSGHSLAVSPTEKAFMRWGEIKREPSQE